MYDTRDDFISEKVKFPFLDGNVPHSPSYGVYNSQIIRFARACSNVCYFNNRNQYLNVKLLKQDYPFLNFVKNVLNCKTQTHVLIV